MRLELRIDVLDKKDQRALAEDDLTPADLIAAILEEFRELDYLSNTPEDYQLRKAQDGTRLEPTVPLRKQVDDTEHLLLTEVELPLPSSAQRPTQQIYLRDLAAGKVYKIQWYPALIGRPDPTQTHNEWIAVNLADHDQGLRVSRQHARLLEDGGRFYIESLSSNPTTIHHEADTQLLAQGQKHPLTPGDLIYLDKSRITLKFLIRAEEGGE